MLWQTSFACFCQRAKCHVHEITNLQHQCGVFSPMCQRGSPVSESIIVSSLTFALIMKVFLSVCLEGKWKQSRSFGIGRSCRLTPAPLTRRSLPLKAFFPLRSFMNGGMLLACHSVRVTRPEHEAPAGRG